MCATKAGVGAEILAAAASAVVTTTSGPCLTQQRNDILVDVSFTVNNSQYKIQHEPEGRRLAIYSSVNA